MKLRAQPHAGSYESTLTTEQQTAFRALLLSDITLAEAQRKAPEWPTGPDIGKKPSIACLGKIRVRLRLEERVARLEGAAVMRRATRNLLRRLVKGTDQEEILDEVMALIGEQMIDACLQTEGASTPTAAAWLLLRRADQRRYDKRTALLQPQAPPAKSAEEKPSGRSMREDAVRRILELPPHGIGDE